jgi:hypothetical protein
MLHLIELPFLLMLLMLLLRIPLMLPPLLPLLRRLFLHLLEMFLGMRAHLHRSTSPDHRRDRLPVPPVLREPFLECRVLLVRPATRGLAHDAVDTIADRDAPRDVDRGRSRTPRLARQLIVLAIRGRSTSTAFQGRH